MMLIIGWIVFLTGFVVGAVGSIPEYTRLIHGIQAQYVFGIGCFIGLVGVVLLHADNRIRIREMLSKSQDEDSDTSFHPENQIKAIVEKLEAINWEELGGVQKAIEEVQDEYILPFVKVRSSLSQMMGLSKFAMMFGEFSTAERYVNRGWSAIVDQYPHEAKRSIEVSIETFKASLKYF